MAYQLEGSMLEVCTCKVICPCWVGEDPDGGTCDGVIAYHIDKGKVNGVDVSGRTFVVLAHIPGNVLKGNWRVVVYVDDKATPQQQEALMKAFTGKLGGPLKDQAQLIGEVVAVERVPITFTVDGGRGRLTIGAIADAEITPYSGATGKPTILSETVFSTIPGSPVFAAKSDYFIRDGRPHDLPSVDLKGHNALQGHFRFAA